MTGYSAGMRHERIQILNRMEARAGKNGIDSSGVEWCSAGCYQVAVDWSKGVRALNAGAVDAYGVVEIRMNWTSAVTMRSRFVYDGVTYQILPETFHANKRSNTIQFLGQAIIDSNGD